MKLAVSSELHLYAPNAKATVIRFKERIEVPDLSTADAPVAFTNPCEINGYLRGDIVDRRVGRRTDEGWLSPALNDGGHLAVDALEGTSNLLSRIAGHAENDCLRPGGPIVKSRLHQHYPNGPTIEYLDAWSRACPSWAKEATRKSIDSLSRSLVCVDGKLHVKVGEPVFVVGSRANHMEQLSAQFSDRVFLTADMALFRIDRFEQAMELIHAGYSRLPDKGLGWRPPEVTFDQGALRRLDQDLAPLELAHSAAESFRALYRSGFLPSPALKAWVPLMRLSEARREITADAVRDPLDTLLAALKAVPKVAYKGKAETPAHYVAHAATYGAFKIGFLNRAVSRLNADYVPSEEDIEALEGLTF